MSDDRWNDLMERERQKAQAAKVVPLYPAPQEEGLPGPNSDYRAASRPSTGGLTRLVVILGKEAFKVGGTPYHAFQYVHLGAEAELGFTETGQVVQFHFTGMSPKLITLHGRNLLQIFDYVQSHRIHWVRQADRDFMPREAVGDNGEPLPIITRIDIESALTPSRV